MERRVEERGWTIADDGEEEGGTMTRSRTEGGMSFCLILILNEKLKKNWIQGGLYIFKSV